MEAGQVAPLANRPLLIKPPQTDLSNRPTCEIG